VTTPVPAHCAAFWAAACRAVPRLAGARFYEAFAFGDSPELAAELAALVLAGRKRATAGLLWSYEAEGRPPPAPGDVSLVTSWDGAPLCVIEITAVDRWPFDAVPAEFAAAEGEGDATLASWRRGHATYFARECARLGRAPAPDMVVVGERFALVYAPAPGASAG
jgi:uncharacterized protein YhfF